MYYYNWHELKQKSNDNFDAILILAYGITLGYNNIIAKSSRELFYKLQINSIPAFLFHRKVLTLDKRQSILFRYENKNPLSYFTNSEFLFSNLHPRIKVEYLYALSNRAIGDTRQYVPIVYFTEELQSRLAENPLLHLDDDKLYFIEETQN